MSNLIIVESPTKAKTLSRFLGGGYRIEATVGHVRDLPEKKLGVEIKISKEKKDNINSRKIYNFTPQYQVISSRKQTVSELKKLALASSSVILATDPDREGEAIAYHVSKILGTKALNRIVFHEITETAIKKALRNPHTIDMQLVDAQQARRILDRLVGYKLSPLLWNKLGKRWLSAGRVQSVTLRLIVDREREIEAFHPVEYWQIEVELKKLKIEDNDSLDSFIARLIKIDDKKAEVSDKINADILVDNLNRSDYKVTKVETREVRRNPVPPFTTSTLQQTASNRLGWSAKRTIKTAQTLYEEGLITYHRTDSTNLSKEAIDSLRIYINNVYGEKFLPPTPKYYKTKSKVAQEAHEAIRPTNIYILTGHDFKKISSNPKFKPQHKLLNEALGRDAEFLYSLIWKRFVACQMNESIFDQTAVDVEAKPKTPGTSNGSYLLRANGQVMKFAGWSILYDRSLGDENDNRENGSDNKLPQLSESEILEKLQVLSSQKFTEPSPRFNEASLIKALEEKGIGRPSTYAPIISTIQNRKYVEKIERRFHPTDLGKIVNDFLVKYFPDVFDIGFTAKMEDELDDIANGKLEWERVVSDFYDPFSTKLDQVFKEAQRVKMDLGTTSDKCPECGEGLVIRLSKYGKFLACSTFPKCKYTQNLVEKADIPCPRCKGDMLVKKTRQGKQFYGCGNYPECTFAAWKKEDIK